MCSYLVYRISVVVLYVQRLTTMHFHCDRQYGLHGFSLWIEYHTGIVSRVAVVDIIHTSRLWF